MNVSGEKEAVLRKERKEKKILMTEWEQVVTSLLILWLLKGQSRLLMVNWS